MGRGTGNSNNETRGQRRGSRTQKTEEVKQHPRNMGRGHETGTWDEDMRQEHGTRT